MPQAGTQRILRVHCMRFRLFPIVRKIHPHESSFRASDHKQLKPNRAMSGNRKAFQRRILSFIFGILWLKFLLAIFLCIDNAIVHESKLQEANELK